MGMFDYVHFKMPCPECGCTTNEWQTKDSDCELDTVEPDGVYCFYAVCKGCGAWIEFARPDPPPVPTRQEPLTKDEVLALGFEMSVQPDGLLGQKKQALQEEPNADRT